MFCRICGASIPEDSIFCPQCGSKLSSSLAKEVTKPDSEIKITEKIVKKTEDGHPHVELFQAPFWRRAIGSLLDKILIILISIITVVIISGINYDFIGDIGTFSAMFHMNTESIHNIAIGHVMPNYPDDYISNHQTEIDEYFHYLFSIELKITSLFLLINIIYMGLFELLFSSSLGKLIMGIKIYGYPYQSAQKISASTVFLRILCLILIIIAVVAARWQFGFNYYVVIALFFLLVDLPVFFKRQSLIDIISSCKLFLIPGKGVTESNMQEYTEEKNIPQCNKKSRKIKWGIFAWFTYFIISLCIIHVILTFYFADYYNIENYYSERFEKAIQRSDNYKYQIGYTHFRKEKIAVKNGFWIGQLVTSDKQNDYDESAFMDGKYISAYSTTFESKYVWDIDYRYWNPRPIYKKYKVINTISTYDINNKMSVLTSDESDYNNYLNTICSKIVSTKKEHPTITTTNGCPSLIYSPDVDTKRAIVCANHRAYIIETKLSDFVPDTKSHFEDFCSILDFSFSETYASIANYSIILFVICGFILGINLLYYKKKRIENKYAYTIFILSVISFLTNIVIAFLQMCAFENKLQAAEISVYVLAGSLLTVVFFDIPLSIYYIKKSRAKWEETFIVPSFLNKLHYDYIRKDNNKKVYKSLVCFPLMALTLLPFGFFVFLIYSIPSLIISTAIIYYGRWKNWVKSPN